jgi:CheY-like chemotaxis protein
MSPYGWQALYRAVALEADFRKMPHCIALAEKAIKQRLFDGPALRIDTAELRAMHSALDGLEILKAESTAQGSVRIKREQMSKAIGVLLADDAEIIRNVLTHMLGTQPEIHILGEAKTFAETLEMTATLRPTVVLMDIHMPGERDFSANFIKVELLSSAKHVLAMSLWNDDESKAVAQSYGASTLLDKSTLASTLIPAIEECIQKDRRAQYA